jgi:hypothetical protein
MKFYIITLITLLSINIAQASTKKEKIELLKCIRKTIDSRRIDQAAMEQTITLLTEYNHYNAAELTNECKNNLVTFKKIPKTTFKNISIFLQNNNSNINPYVNHLLYLLIQNPTNCKVKGIELDAAIGIGAGVGAAVGKCRGGNGKNWSVISPSYSINLGLGITAMMSELEFNITRGAIVADNDELVYTIAFIGGLRGNFYAQVRAVGVGFALMIGGSQSYVLNMIPAGQDFRELIETLDRM